MSLISVVITLAVIGILLWFLNSFLPREGKIKQILNAVGVICVIVWLLSVFGVLGHWGAIRAPQL